jgi:hypothetical protein
MFSENQPGQPNNNEKYDINSIEEVRQHIENYENDKEKGGVGSVRFKAFADYVDREYSRCFPSSPTRDMQFLLIGETIRQRAYEIPGYQREFEASSNLASELHRAMWINGKLSLDSIGLEAANISESKIPKDIQLLDHIKYKIVDSQHS